MQNAPTLVGQRQEHVEDLKAEGRHGEEVDGNQTFHTNSHLADNGAMRQRKMEVVDAGSSSVFRGGRGTTRSLLSANESPSRLPALSRGVAPCHPAIERSPDGPSSRLAAALGAAVALRLGPRRRGRPGGPTPPRAPACSLHRRRREGFARPVSGTSASGGVLVIAPVPAAYEKALGRPVHPSLVYRALHRQGWRKMMPRPKHPQASEEGRAAFKKLPEIVPAQKAAPADSPGQTLPVRLMFEDEARWGRRSDPRRCWAPAGRRPEVAVPRVPEYESACAAVSPHDGVRDPLVRPTGNAEALSVFFAAGAQRHPHELILRLLDGAGWHRAKRRQVPANLLGRLPACPR